MGIATGEASAYAELDTPAVVVDMDKVERNARVMAEYMKVRKVVLRPHAKTHKNVDIARVQVEAGAVGLTVPPVTFPQVIGLTNS